MYGEKNNTKIMYGEKNNTKIIYGEKNDNGHFWQTKMHFILLKTCPKSASPS